MVNAFYTHRLDELLTISGVKAGMETQLKADYEFGLNWEIVGVTEEFARAMHDAVTNAVSRILPWLKTQW